MAAHDARVRALGIFSASLGLVALALVLGGREERDVGGGRHELWQLWHPKPMVPSVTPSFATAKAVVTARALAALGGRYSSTEEEGESPRQLRRPFPVRKEETLEV